MILKLLKKIVYNLLYKSYYDKLESGEAYISTNELRSKNETYFYNSEERIFYTQIKYSILPDSVNPEWIKKLETPQFYSGASYSIIEDSFLVGKHATAIKDSRVILDTFSGNKAYLIRKGDRRRIRFHKLYQKTKEFNWAFSLVNCVNYSYFHWVAEALPLLEALYEFEKRNPDIRKTPILVNSPTPNFIYQYLEIAGIEKERIIEWGWKKVKVKKLIVPSLRYVRPEGTFYNFYSKSGFDFLRDTFLCKNEIESKTYSQKIYITRKDANYRNIINEEELVQLIEKYGYKSYVLGTLSIKEQITLFKNAKEIIAPHGAGLINSIFSRNSLKIIELFPKTRNLDSAYYFYQASLSFDHNHTLIICDCNQNQDIEVDIEKIQYILNQNLTA